MQRAADQIYIYWLLSLHNVVYLLILSSFLLVCQSNYCVYGIQILAFYASWLALPGSLVFFFFPPQFFVSYTSILYFIILYIFILFIYYINTFIFIYFVSYKTKMFRKVTKNSNFVEKIYEDYVSSQTFPLNIYQVAKSCLTLQPHGPPPGSSSCGIYQARILEWFAISFSKGSSWPRNQTCVSCITDILLHWRQSLSHGATQEVHTSSSIHTIYFTFWYVL